ncbi:MAG TPA: hypothetical protein VE967_08810 [Gemmatimonadaceae bacterium]|nr:hypothetical protein [Gemmatimonadaceae bacterium]
MVRRKFTTSVLAGTLAAVALVGACRDSATTGPSNVPSRSYAALLKLQGGNLQNGPVALPLAQQLQVQVTDAGGHPVQGASVNWTVIGGGGSVNPPTGVSDAAGFVRTSWTLGTNLGENKVRAYLTGAYLLDSTTFTATATNGQGVIIKVVESTAPPTTAPVATTLTAVTFLITDQFGHPAPGSVVTFSASAGTVNPTTAIADSTGHVSTIWTTSNFVGTATITATLAGQLPVVNTLTTTPDTSRRLTIISGNNQVTTVGGTIPSALTVQVTDRFGNPITGEAVTFSDSIGNGGTVQPTAALTDVAGMASTVWKVGTMAGPQRIRVKIGSSGGQFVRFNSTVNVSFRDVFVGSYYACGVSTNDRAYCWGFGEDGQLGIEAKVTRNAPTWPVTSTDTIAGPYPTFREISGGPSHACGVGISRQLFCWGFSPDGRIFATPGSPFAIAPQATQSSIRTVATGNSFTCVITLGALALCAGTNEVGETGANPPPVNGYAFITAGQRHGCGMSRFDPAFPVLTRTPQCWGANNNGQLGDGLATFLDQAAPVPVAMPVGITFDSTSLVAGAQHTCALVSFDAPAGAGTAYCWGSNAFGQLGKDVGLFPATRESTPRPVAGNIAFARLYAGEYHTCGLTAAGQAYCWGRNTTGQLGTGNTTQANTPVQVLPGMQFRNLALGELFSCGITGPGPVPTGTTGTAGIIFCWGDNEMGQLGTAAFGANGSPVLVPQRVAFQQ